MYISRSKKSFTTSAVIAAGSGWAPLTPEEHDEITYLSSINSHFRETKELVEEIMKNEALEKNEKNMFVFRLENADYPYSVQDLPLVKASLVKGEVEVEIARYEALCDVVVKPVGSKFDSVRSDISKRIKNWMKARDMEEKKKMQKDFVPETDEMCLVRWPQWDKFFDLMVDGFGEDWVMEFYDDERGLAIYEDDFECHSGKWFRASCVSVHHKRDKNKMCVGVYEVLLVDLGKITLIPPKEIYKMPHRFMLDYQMSLFTTVALDDIVQYDDDVDEKWKYLLLPGMKVLVRFEWMYDEMNIIKLISPSENDFNKHFLDPAVKEGIEIRRKREQASLRARKVSQMSKDNPESTTEENMKIVLEEEQEAETQKLVVEDYSAIGRCHSDQVFELCLPAEEILMPEELYD